MKSCASCIVGMKLSNVIVSALAFIVPNRYQYMFLPLEQLSYLLS
jgi:hypothetical protein